MSGEREPRWIIPPPPTLALSLSLSLTHTHSHKETVDFHTAVQKGQTWLCVPPLGSDSAINIDYSLSAAHNAPFFFPFSFFLRQHALFFFKPFNCDLTCATLMSFPQTPVDRTLSFEGKRRRSSGCCIASGWRGDVVTHPALNGSQGEEHQMDFHVVLSALHWIFLTLATVTQWARLSLRRSDRQTKSPQKLLHIRIQTIWVVRHQTSPLLWARVAHRSPWTPVQQQGHFDKIASQQKS